MITLDGLQYGTAGQIAAALGPDVTPAMVRRWADRGRITRYGRWYRLDQAAAAERDTRTSPRGRPRRVDADALLSA